MGGPEIFLASMAAAAGSASQIAATNKAAQTMAENAKRQYDLSNSLIAQQQKDAAAETGYELTNKQREFSRTLANISVAQAESGVVGNTPLRDIANLYMQEAFTEANVVAGGETNQRKLAYGSQNAFNEMTTKQNTAKSSAITGFQAGLQIASAGVSGGLAGYSAGKTK